MGWRAFLLLVFAACTPQLAAETGSDPSPSSLQTPRAERPDTAHQDQPPSVASRQIRSFQLPDYYGKTHSLDDYRQSRLIVVAFLGTECPLAKLYGPRLESLAAEYDSRNVQFLGINANRQDSLSEVAAYGRRHHIDFPLLKDTTGEATDDFGATRTPEVFVLDEQRRIRYQGRVDDQYGVGYITNAPKREDLREAIEDLLAGRSVRIDHTEAVGCLIGRRRHPDESSPVTYSNQVARVLQTHCVECHREGEIAPFALQSYDEVVGWADMIREVVRQQRMPPWSANPAHGKFANARLMSAEEKQLIYDWVAAGAPEGNPDELPEPREYVTGWRLPREPDLVVAMSDKPFDVPAEGVIEYQYFAVDPGFEEDKWVSASDVVPGERSVVHHVIVFISPPEGERRRGLGFLSAYVPGQSSMQFPTGQARLVPAGSKLIFQMHYTPNGTRCQDLTRVGLNFADPETVTEEVVTVAAIEEKFEIPPGVTDHRVNKTKSHWPRDGRLLSMSPHMHLRGKSFRFTAHWPDGRREILLDIPHYDFNWQNIYELAQPIKIPEDFAIECEAHYDNSEDNLTNPDPKATVRWGDQSWDEMMIGFFEVAVPRGSWDAPRKKKSAGPTDEQLEQAQRATEELFGRFDANHDDRIDRDELPSTFRHFAFYRYDLNNDRVITKDEAFEFALHSDGRS